MIHSIQNLENLLGLALARTLIKKVREEEDPAAARVLLNETKSYLDRLATKGLLKKNQVANYKGQLERHVNALEG